MPHITFTQDVTLESEPSGTGPHFRRGYSPDVSEDQARKWIGKGVAVRGVVSVEAKAPESVDKNEETVSTFRKRKARFER